MSEAVLETCCICADVVKTSVEIVEAIIETFEFIEESEEEGVGLCWWWDCRFVSVGAIGVVVGKFFVGCGG